MGPTVHRGRRPVCHVKGVRGKPHDDLPTQTSRQVIQPRVSDPPHQGVGEEGGRGSEGGRGERIAEKEEEEEEGC